MVNPNGGTIGAGSEGSVAGAAGGLLLPLLNTAAGFYDTYQSNKTARRNTDKTIAANRKEAELAYQRSVEMWHMQNAYNSPQAQMERFKAAGLNPHLIYGQGNSGNASGAPEYHAPDIQYRYAAPTYGGAIQSILPTLMSVGTWLQNMRLGEARYDQMESTTERARQMVEYLETANPMLLRKLDNQLEMFPYQKSMQMYGSDLARQRLFQFEQQFRQEYGEPLFQQMDPRFDPGSKGWADIGGTKRLEFLRKQAEVESQRYKNKLLEAQSSWTDYDITNPQGIMQLVVSGVMGLAGAGIKGLRFNRNAPKVTHELESISKTGRRQIRRRTYQK